MLALLPAGVARNALDCALWDLEARLAGTGVAALSGAPEPSRIESALTVVIDKPPAMAAAAHRIAHAPLIKIKVDATIPDAQVRAVKDKARAEASAIRAQ